MTLILDLHLDPMTLLLDLVILKIYQRTKSEVHRSRHWKVKSLRTDRQTHRQTNATKALTRRISGWSLRRCVNEYHFTTTNKKMSIMYLHGLRSDAVGTAIESTAKRPRSAPSPTLVNRVCDYFLKIAFYYSFVAVSHNCTYDWQHL